MSTLVINNYSAYTITGRLRATDLTNCVPEIYMGNTLGSGNFTIPPTTTTRLSQILYSQYSTNTCK
ncbi:hypothetical protein [Chryseobacterium indoltheticum]|uniref:hypothetical protein n=1 Tax=Chryseobacterium indoltheticum TaxID=254 RepID=UPI003F492A48